MLTLNIREGRFRQIGLSSNCERHYRNSTFKDSYRTRIVPPFQCCYQFQAPFGEM